MTCTCPTERCQLHGFGFQLRPPTYPLRPVNGGPLPKAQRKHGDWYYEPKYNGWRALVHVPTGTMFNRKNERLSIEREFAAALTILREAYAEFEWLDCEALERRHNLGRGTLVVLDIPSAAETYLNRRRRLETCGVSGSGMVIPHCASQPLQNNTVYLTPSVKQGETLWNLLREANGPDMLGCEFYEGVVAKRADSRYPHQLRSASEEFPFWMKHRWAF